MLVLDAHTDIVLLLYKHIYKGKKKKTSSARVRHFINISPVFEMSEGTSSTFSYNYLIKGHFRVSECTPALVKGQLNF